DPAGQYAREVRVSVGEAGKHRPPSAVDTLGVRVPREKLGGGPERGDPAVAHGDRRVVQDRPRVVRRDDRRVVDELDRRHPAYSPVATRDSTAEGRGLVRA